MKLRLIDPETKETIRFKISHISPHCRGGICEAKFDVENSNIKKICGMTGKESIPILEKMAKNSNDFLILQLIAMAKMRINGVWIGD